MASAYQIHPEFGYLCISPGLRRTFKVALGFVVIGSIAVASQTGLPIADRESNTNNSPTIAATPPDPGPAPSDGVASPADPTPGTVSLSAVASCFIRKKDFEARITAEGADQSKCLHDDKAAQPAIDRRSRESGAPPRSSTRRGLV